MKKTLCLSVLLIGGILGGNTPYNGEHAIDDLKKFLQVITA